jgi:hypothetical protein
MENVYGHIVTCVTLIDIVVKTAIVVALRNVSLTPGFNYLYTKRSLFHLKS